MEIRAAVVRERGGPFQLETLHLADPRADEVLVRILSTGICHSDISIANGLFPPAPPVVLGHEGAGVVEATGADVRGVAVGDHVVLSFDSCGVCRSCGEGHPVFCEDYTAHNGSGRRADGSATLLSSTGPVGGSFLGQSSFATHALARERNAVKVRVDAPLELLGPLGCAVQTGVGAVLNVIKPRAGEGLAVFGCGGVGLSAIMGARIAGCSPIIAIDRLGSRLEMARDLGATHTLNTQRGSPADAIVALGGVPNLIEASGVPSMLAEAFAALPYGGVLGILSGYPLDATLLLQIQHAFFGKTIIGIVEGDADPQRFIPRLVDLLMEGHLPPKKLVRFYPFDEINEAAEASLRGEVIKPVLRM